MMALPIPSSPSRSTHQHQRTPSASGLLGTLVAHTPLANLFSSPQLNYLPIPDDNEYNGESSKSGSGGVHAHRVELKLGGMTVSVVYNLGNNTIDYRMGS